MTHTITTTVIPAQAGIQPDEHFPAKRDNIIYVPSINLNPALSATRDFLTSWIPACAGMTRVRVSR